MPFLERLTEFNEALVYGFDSETPLKYLIRQEQGEVIRAHDIRVLCSHAAQYEDMYNAYLYAQNSILPGIKQQGIANLSAEQLLIELDAIHARIALNLIADQIGDTSEAGHYITEGNEIVRWHPGGKFQVGLIDYLSRPSVTVEQHNQVMQAVSKTYGVNSTDLEAFLDLAKAYRADLKGKIDRMVAADAITKLFDDEMWGRLPKEKSKILRKVVILGMPASRIPQKMREFAEETVAGWKKCNPDDMDELAKFLSKTFFGLTDIHPYANGNGRTATCLINIILRSFGRSSILLRNPQERDDPNSSYSRAMKGLGDGDDSLLAEHIKARMTEVKQGKIYADSSLKETVTLRVKARELIHLFQKHFPQFDFPAFFEAAMDEAAGTDNEEVDNSHFLKAINILNNKYNELRFASEGKEKLKSALTAIIGPADWSTNAKGKDGVTAWYELSEAEAKTLESKHADNPAFTIKKRTITKKDNITFLIMITHIDIDKLLKEAEALSAVNEVVNNMINRVVNKI